MTTLREAAQQALEEWHIYPGSVDMANAMMALEAALAEPERKPLTEEQVERAYQKIWRDSPDDFGRTASEWIEAGIRYAERVHGIGEQK